MNSSDLSKNIRENTKLLDRFLKYVQIDTQADAESTTFPSSMIQKDLARALKIELDELGLDSVETDENGYVYGCLKGNREAEKKVVFLAHLDVAVDCKGIGVKPVLHKDYSGEDLTLPSGLTISRKENVELGKCLGDTIITSDGTTLLGADNKAGIAEIVSMIEYLKKNPHISRPDIYICFTPDEEVGKGVDKINMDKLPADFAYTVDGGFPFEVNYENFDAYHAKVVFKGINYHPGHAKDKMVNALRCGSLFVDLLPSHMSPEHTSGREAFIHPINIKGDVNTTTVNLILRGFSIEDIEHEKEIILSIIEHVKKVAPGIEVEFEATESYRNMRTVIEDHKYVVEYLREAGKKLDFDLSYEPIRGGTDGARLSFMGLPCPNIFTGGVNFHSTKEWISFEKMSLTVAFLVTLVQTIE